MSRSKDGIVVGKVTGDIVRRLSSVKALWFSVHNDPELSVQDAAVEFYFAVGKLLEGVPIEQLAAEFRKISGDRVLQHMREG